MMNTHIRLEIRGLSFPWGFLLSSSAVGGSMDRARAASASMTKLIHSRWMAFSGDSPMVTAAIIASKIATMFTVSWNWRNREIDAEMFLLYMTAFITEVKSSLGMMILHAPLATSVLSLPCLLSEWIRVCVLPMCMCVYACVHAIWASIEYNHACMRAREYTSVCIDTSGPK